MTSALGAAATRRSTSSAGAPSGNVTVTGITRPVPGTGSGLQLDDDLVVGQRAGVDRCLDAPAPDIDGNTRLDLTLEVLGVRAGRGCVRLDGNAVPGDLYEDMVELVLMKVA